MAVLLKMKTYYLMAMQFDFEDLSVNALQSKSTKKAATVEFGVCITYPSKIRYIPQRTVRCLGRRGSFLTPYNGSWALTGRSGESSRN